LNGSLDAEGKDKVWYMSGCPPGWNQDTASMLMQHKNLRTLESLIINAWPFLVLSTPKQDSDLVSMGSHGRIPQTFWVSSQ